MLPACSPRWWWCVPPPTSRWCGVWLPSWSLRHQAQRWTTCCSNTQSGSGTTRTHTKTRIRCTVHCVLVVAQIRTIAHNGTQRKACGGAWLQHQSMWMSQGQSFTVKFFVLRGPEQGACLDADIVSLFPCCAVGKSTIRQCLHCDCHMRSTSPTVQLLP